MTRVIGIAVAVAVIAPTFLLLASQVRIPENNLPACCRRDGKHHCAMMAVAINGTQEIQIRANTEACPFRSHASSIAHVASYLPVASAVYFGALLSHPAIHAQTRAAFRVSEERTHHKRGPPAYSC